MHPRRIGRLASAVAVGLAVLAGAAVPAHAEGGPWGPSDVTVPEVPTQAEVEAAEEPPAAGTLAERVCATEPATFGPRADDPELAAELLGGSLRFPGDYPAVDLPADPDWNERLINQDNWETKYQGLAWTDPLRREAIRLAASEPDKAAEYRSRYEFLLRDFTYTNRNRNRPAEPTWTWYDFSTGQRATVFACATTLLGKPDWLVTAMKQHATALSDGSIRYRGRGNHSLMMNNGLLSVGCVLPNRDWFRLGSARDGKLLPLAISWQGVTDEGSIAYQGTNYMWWRDHKAKREVCAAASTSLWNRIAKMPAFSANARFPDGQFAAFGDTRETRSGDADTAKRPAAVLDYDRGYLFSRAAGGAADASMLALRYGPPREVQSHGHWDAGSVLFYANGQKALTDSGAHAYGGGFWRSWVVSPKAHSVISVDGAKPVATKSTPLTALTQKTGMTHASVVVRNIPGATWRRTVLHDRAGGWLLVDDQVTQTTARTLSQRWMMTDGVSYRANGRRIDQSGGGLSIVNLAGASKLYLREGYRSGDVAEGWRSYQYGTIEPSPAAVTRYKAKTWHAVTLIAVRPKGVAPSAVRGSNVRVTASAVSATIDTPAGRTAVYLSPTKFIGRRVS